MVTTAPPAVHNTPPANLAGVSTQKQDTPITSLLMSYDTEESRVPRHLAWWLCLPHAEARNPAMARLLKRCTAAVYRTPLDACYTGTECYTVHTYSTTPYVGVLPVHITCTASACCHAPTPPQEMAAGDCCHYPAVAAAAHACLAVAAAAAACYRCC